MSNPGGMGVDQFPGVDRFIDFFSFVSLVILMFCFFIVLMGFRPKSGMKTAIS